ncbi:MAG TPA: hypothetical protein VFS45_00280 [Sphingomicrobium sp.]|nr:hypothetical protein [Sphingomicrobium sp.]
MLSIAMSRAASGLLRALLDRAGDQRDRSLLSEIRSVDWQSLTFAGERHLVTLRVPGPGADSLVHAFLDGIEEAEFAIPGHIVADIAPAGTPMCELDHSVRMEIEALTVLE